MRRRKPNARSPKAATGPSRPRHGHSPQPNRPHGPKPLETGSGRERRPEADHRRHERGGRPDLPVWLYGRHACLAALQNPHRYLRRLLLTREALAELQGHLPPHPQPEIVDRSRLEATLPAGAVHQGIAVFADPLDDPGIEGLRVPPESGRDTVLVLDHVTDPRNIGAVLRSAAAFGARALLVTDRHAPEATGALAKAASGGLEIVPIIRVTNLSRALDQLAEYGFWRIGLEMAADRTLAQAVQDIHRIVLVLGAEDEGLRRLTREKCDFLARLPMTGAVESLNVSAAAAIALYECVRR
ncbi:MAG TPA: 23S rRNA (guanosine(2251)-2'-O)-methyltransferase RlmB [Ferrovibrio sp.]|jgi:23S rRNA (guanosine2251-2'-O)-methyltransferase|uniref:23S rRNA (guanosine(2251)-2'-O)-methyltransferase RlmB n=1 Tax=Ferrovibrio sp. TaxID=1917215 RepID=UPI002ED4B959